MIDDDLPYLSSTSTAVLAPAHQEIPEFCFLSSPPWKWGPQRRAVGNRKEIFTHFSLLSVHAVSDLQILPTLCSLHPWWTANAPLQTICFFSFYDTIFPSKVNRLFHTLVTWRLDYCIFLQNLPTSYGIVTIKKNMFLSYLFSHFVFSTQVRHFPKENICHYHYLAARLNLPTVFACVTG